MPEEMDIVKVLPETFSQCVNCKPALSMCAQLISRSEAKLFPRNGALIVEVACRLPDDLTTNNVEMSSKVQPIPRVNNLFYWAYYPHIKKETCPGLEHKNK